MSQIRRSSVRKISDNLWLNDRGEKLQMVDGMLLPSSLTLTREEADRVEEIVKGWGKDFKGEGVG